LMTESLFIADWARARKTAIRAYSSYAKLLAHNFLLSAWLSGALGAVYLFVKPGARPTWTVGAGYKDG